MRVARVMTNNGCAVSYHIISLSPDHPETIPVAELGWSSDPVLCRDVNMSDIVSSQYAPDIDAFK